MGVGVGVLAWLLEEVVGFPEGAVPSCHLVERIICAWSLLMQASCSFLRPKVGWEAGNGEQGWSP